MVKEENGGTCAHDISDCATRRECMNIASSPQHQVTSSETMASHFYCQPTDNRLNSFKAPGVLEHTPRDGGGAWVGSDEEGGE